MKCKTSANVVPILTVGVCVCVWLVSINSEAPGQFTCQNDNQNSTVYVLTIDGAAKLRES